MRRSPLVPRLVCSVVLLTGATVGTATAPASAADPVMTINKIYPTMKVRAGGRIVSEHSSTLTLRSPWDGGKAF